MDRAGQYRWRLKARNGEIVAVSEAYTTRYNAKRSAELVKTLAPYASIVCI
ncbi:MAG: YegP family protein [Candidatus Falkowbacteria bacterium]|nr:YegP family protein [Candidatus Parcubacteria bacterium]